MDMFNCPCETNWKEESFLWCIWQLINCHWSSITFNCRCCVVLTVSFVGLFCYCIMTKKNNPLHQATMENDTLNTIRLIKKNKKWINEIHSTDGFSPFMRSCKHGNSQLIKYMISNGANVHLKSRDGRTPFHLCVHHFIEDKNAQDVLCLHLLLAAGADINETDNKGFTPLHSAALFGIISVCEWLIQHDALMCVLPTPYALAKFEGHYETALIIKHHMRIKLGYK